MDTPELTPLQVEQLDLENQIAEEGVRRYWQRVHRVRERGLETVSTPVQHAMRTFVDPLADGLTERYAAAHKKPGRKTAFVKLLFWADMSVVSLLALRTVLDSVSRPRRWSTVAMRIGREVEEELRFQAFEQQKKPLYETVQRSIRESPRSYNRDYRRKVLVHTANKYDVFWEPWTDEQRYGVGVWLLDSIVEFTGLVTSRLVKTQRGTMSSLIVTPTPALLEWMDQQHRACEGLTPRRAPMVCPPVEWTDPFAGGYLTTRLRETLIRLPFITRAEIHSTYSHEQMPVVYDAVNALQRTALRVNDTVYLASSQLWDQSSPLPDVERADVPLPPKPPEGSPEKEWTEYKRRAKGVRNHNDQMRGRRMSTSLTLAMAGKYRNKAIWFPYKLDFRGRIYAQPNFLEPQGADLAKGLLELEEAEHLDDRGRWWLNVHTANCWGVDKCAFEDRIEWVNANADMLERVALDPLEYRDWYDADAPFQFLAAARAWLDDQRGRPVSLPVMVDGSCNGIQHLAAMSLDAEAGALVNLIPSDIPGDIYSVVAAALEEKVRQQLDKPKAMKSANGQVRWTTSQARFFASAWLEFGLTRKLAKRPTMILPYNGTYTATEKYITEYVVDTIRKGAPDPFGRQQDLAIQFLTGLIRPAMRKVARGPVQIMEWTRELAKPVAEAKTSLSWMTPSGFVVHQRYREMVSRRVKTHVGDRIYKLSLAEQTDAIDYRKQAQSFAPNWIHSYDAAALQLTLAAAQKESIAMLANHDSYGAHPNRMDRLGEILREKFVECYAERNAMEQLRADVARFARISIDDLPEPPPLGTLDIRDVLRSPFFFA